MDELKKVGPGVLPPGLPLRQAGTDQPHLLGRPVGGRCPLPIGPGQGNDLIRPLDAIALQHPASGGVRLLPRGQGNEGGCRQCAIGRQGQPDPEERPAAGYHAARRDQDGCRRACQLEHGDPLPAPPALLSPPLMLRRVPLRLLHRLVAGHPGELWVYRLGPGLFQFRLRLGEGLLPQLDLRLQGLE